MKGGRDGHPPGWAAAGAPLIGVGGLGELLHRPVVARRGSSSWEGATRARQNHPV
jgi:hypothetical protein